MCVCVCAYACVYVCDTRTIDIYSDVSFQYAKRLLRSEPATFLVVRRQLAEGDEAALLCVVTSLREALAWGSPWLDFLSSFSPPRFSVVCYFI